MLVIASAAVITFGAASQFIVPALASDYRASDIESAVQNLYSEDSGTRKSAIYTISEMGPEAKAAVPKLTEILQSDPFMPARGEAAKALGKIGAGAASAVPALIEFLQGSEGGYERAYAATALGDIKVMPDKVLPVLVSTMTNSGENPTIRQLAARSLGEFGASAQSTLPQLIEAIKSGPKDLRDASCDALRTIPAGAQDVPSITKLLDDEIDAVKVAACGSLGRTGAAGAAAVPALLKLLGDSKIDVRLAAIAALGGIGPEAKMALPALKKALKDPETQSAAERAIDGIKHAPQT